MTAGVPSARTLPELLRDTAAAAPEHDALVTDEGRWTYAQLLGEVDAAAAALATRGVGRGDTVALLIPNTAQWLIAAFAGLSLGARVDAFNTWVKAYDLDHLLRVSGASTLVMVDDVRGRSLLHELNVLLPELWAQPAGELHSTSYASLRRALVIGDDVPPGAESWHEAVTGASGAPAGADEGRGDAGRDDEPAFVVYTSGSTSTPKAVPLCHRNLVVNGFHIGERMGLSADDRVWFGSPLFWSFGCANALMATLTHGACLVLQGRFEPRSAVETMAAEGVTAAYLLPAMVDALAREVPAAMRAVTTLRTGVMIGRPEEITRAAVELGVTEICNIYGSTETYGNCCVTDHRWPLERRAASQGEPLPGVQVRVVDPDTGVELPAGQPGELQVTGRVTPGYLGDAEANAEAFTADGWFRTGDRMLVNPDGTVVFVGRISDMIKSSGINVSPAEVESFLSTHPSVGEVVVLGAPHPTRDEVVVAYVVPKDATGGELTAQAVIDYCKERLAGYKIPWAVEIVDELPHTVTGKLVRKDLRAPAAELVNAMLSSRGDV